VLCKFHDELGYEAPALRGSSQASARNNLYAWAQLGPLPKGNLCVSPDIRV